MFRRGKRTGRRWFAPEAIQASPMDCGPTALYSLLTGFKIPVSYERLRRACQTDVDGTSINALERVAQELGLDARQLLVPTEHIGHKATGSLPAILVTTMPGGALHFVLAWRRLGPWIQIMDPGSGRRWVSRKSLRAMLHRHAVELPADKWHASRATPAARAVLVQALRDLGHPSAPQRVDDSIRDPGWLSIAALEAATSMARSLVQSGAISRGEPAARLIDALHRGACTGQGDQTSIPGVYWSVQPAQAEQDPERGRDQAEAPCLLVRGALSVRVQGFLSESLPQEGTLRQRPKSTLYEPRLRVGRTLWRHLTSLDRGRVAALVGYSVLAALTVVAQAVLFRALFELGSHLQLDSQRLAAASLLVLFLAGLTLVELPLADGLLRLGRHLEIRVRRTFQERLPRLPQSWFESRGRSDLAERAHALFSLREFSPLGGRTVRTVATLVLTGACLAWLDPAALPWVLLAIGGSCVLPLLFHKALRERELLVRGHHGALSRFYLEALLGLVAARVHGAQRALRREHEGLLVEWNRAGLELARGATLFRIITGLFATGMALTLVATHVLRHGPSQATLLFAYWSLALPMYGEQLGQSLLSLHPLQNAARRALEPLGVEPQREEPRESTAPIPSVAPGAAVRLTSDPTRELKAAGATAPAPLSSAPRPPRSLAGGAVSLELREVSLRRSGNAVLEEIELRIEPGQHVALVGRSGAGKSSLIGLLLGLHEPSEGALLVDDERLQGEALVRLRSATAWVDPAVQLWNRTLFANLIYGTGSTSESSLVQALEDAQLTELAADLPQGLGSPLGEAGTLVSGGEGQRLRLARALLRPGVRLALLDEPFRGVDRKAREVLLRRARQHWRHATLLCATHDLSETESFDRVLVFERGRLVEDGHPLVLKSDPTSTYAQLLDAERSLFREGWSAPGWKRWRVSNGGLEVQGQPEGGEA